jgi:hypothetical protein
LTMAIGIAAVTLIVPCFRREASEARIIHGRRQNHDTVSIEG